MIHLRERARRSRRGKTQRIAESWRVLLSCVMALTSLITGHPLASSLTPAEGYGEDDPAEICSISLCLLPLSVRSNPALLNPLDSLCVCVCLCPGETPRDVHG